MPRRVTEQLDGYRLSVLEGEAQKVDNGTPVFMGTGAPVMVRVYLLVFSATKPDGEQHVVQFQMTEEGKEAVVKALTGGIEIAKHLPSNGEIVL